MMFSMSLQPSDNWTWNVAWWSDPVLLGHYPEEGLRLYEPYLPKITDADMKLISEPLDIYGQNIYNGRCFRMGPDGKPQEVTRPLGAPKTAVGWPVTPECIYWGLKYLDERYHMPMYLTENGMACHDCISLDGKVHDPNRIDFLARYLKQVKRAASEIDLRGYFEWTLLDNFEWNKGYAERFGLVYVVSGTEAPAQDGYFTSFITSTAAPIVFMFIFLALTAWVVYLGVEKGIEKYSRILMPILLILIIGIAIFSLTLSYETEYGTVRTGLHGLAVYLIPNVEGLTVKRFLEILLDAMSQLFFSLSVSMGIMITYGSYVKDDVNLSKSINQIEIFDTGVAFLSGLMIIPAVFVFLGTDGMTSGPSLTFLSLPKVFASMGAAGRFVGIAFFLMLGFAALTSCVSVMETLVANCMELFHKSRKKMCVIIGTYSLVTAVIICLGYNVFYFDLKLPNGSVGQLLDLADYISNSFLMPVASAAPIS